MKARIAVVLVSCSLLGSGVASRLLAHEGHDHKLMGTVVQAAADHVTLKDKEGKNVTVRVTDSTRIKSKLPVKIGELKAGTRVVVTAAVGADRAMVAKLIEVGIGPAPAR